jgi:tripartite-type tricarboxylate transporter receptor subunit TctC
LGCEADHQLADIPTLKDIGINMVVNSPYGIAGPKGMEPIVVRAIHDAFKKGLDEPAFTATLSQLDEELIYMSSEDYHAFAMKQINEERRTVQELDLKDE